MSASRRRSRRLADFPNDANDEPSKRQRDSESKSNLAPQSKPCVLRALSRWRYPGLQAPPTPEDRGGIFPNVSHEVEVMIASYLGLGFLLCAEVNSDWLKGVYFTWPNITALRLCHPPPSGLVHNFAFEHGETLIINFTNGAYDFGLNRHAQTDLLGLMASSNKRLSHLEISWDLESEETDFLDDESYDDFHRSIGDLVPSSRRLKVLKLDVHPLDSLGKECYYASPTHGLHACCSTWLTEFTDEYEGQGVADMGLEGLIFKDLRMFKGRSKQSIAIKIKEVTIERIQELDAEYKQKIVAMVIAELIPTWRTLVELDFFPGYRLIGEHDCVAFAEALALHCPCLKRLRFAGTQHLKLLVGAFQDIMFGQWAESPIMIGPMSAREGWLYKEASMPGVELES